MLADWREVDGSVGTLEKRDAFVRLRKGSNKICMKLGLGLGWVIVGNEVVVTTNEGSLHWGRVLPYAVGVLYGVTCVFGMERL